MSRVLQWSQGEMASRLPSHRHSGPGFTLLEIMVALAIVATAFTALLGLRNRDIVMHDHARAMIHATVLAQQRMGDVMVGTFPDLGTSDGAFDEESSRYAWHQEVKETPFEFVREVLVSVTWGGSAENRVDVVRYVFQK